MTALQERIIEGLKLVGFYAEKGINSHYPDIIEESIYTARELGVDYFLDHTCMGPKLRQIVIRECVESETLRIKKELQKNAMAQFRSSEPYTEVDDAIKIGLLRKLEAIQAMR